MNIYFLLAMIFVYCLFIDIRIMRRQRTYKGRTTAKIVSVREYTYYYKFEKVRNYRPTFQYTVDGVTYEDEFIIWYREDENSHPVGMEVPILYDINKPERFVPDEEERWKKMLHNSKVALIVVVVLPFVFWLLLQLKAYHDA